jgi:hypothetical protein
MMAKLPPVGAPITGKFSSTSVNPTGPAATSVPPTSVPPADVNTSTPGGATSKVKLEDAKGLSFQSWGDPHEVSGDGLKFDNMGIGYFTAMKSASGDLMVTKRHESVPGLGAVGSTVNTEVGIKAGEDVVKYDTKTNKFYINDKETALKDGEAVNLPGGGKVVKKGNEITVTTPKGDNITIVDQGKYLDLKGTLAASRKDGEVTGSLGRFDADTDASNDLVMRDGSQAANVDSFIKEWTTPDAENLLTQPAAKFQSAEAKEIAALRKENEELFKKEQALSDERRPLLADIAKNESIYKALKELPDNMLAEADKTFMKKFEDTKAKVDDLGKQIADLNARQAENQKKIDALVKIAELKGHNALLFDKEQSVSHERRPLLAQQAEMKPKAEFLQDLQKSDPAKVSEADLTYLKNWSALLDKIAQLTKLISDLNKEQADNEAEIAEQDKIAHPDKAVAQFKAPATNAARAA